MKTIVWQNASSTIYLVDDNGQRSARKELNRDFPDRRALRRLDNEYDTLRHLEEQGVAGVRRCRGRGKEGARHFLLFEYFSGVTLSEFFVGERPLDVFLRVAVRLARVLHEVHQAGIVHRDVTSKNLLVDPDDESVCVIDFELSSRVDLKRPFLGNPKRLEGTLHYISPEQSGRINRVVDRRSDLYSFGVCLYRALAGRLPFDADDPMELVHSHIARIPEPPANVASDVPQVLSDIVMRLLAKDAEHRYQSAFGLAEDLQRCLETLTADGDIPTFDLGAEDHSDRFLIPQKLYGRQTETQALLDAFQRVNGGALELLLVSGYSGTGKTALVAETHRPVSNRRGYFVDGKFDQFKRNIPYYAFIRALEQLVALLLTEDEATLERWSTLISEAAGQEGAVLLEVLPTLKAIIGPQPPVPELQGKEAQNRFNYVFRNFIKTISRPEHPLILFIDDLQWADTGSLDLLRLLSTDPDNQYLLVICAYRDNEVSPTHPFVLTVKEIEEAGVRIERIHTDNLSAAHVTALVAESLDVPLDDARELAQLVHDKTSGNAFFVRQFLRSLFENGQLVYVFDKARWEWDVDAIRALRMTDNVVELLAAKMRKLAPELGGVLKLAACIGDRFDLATLEMASDDPPEVLERLLQDAMIEGLLAPIDDDTLKFTHDRVQQAAYSLIDEADRAALHLQIGRHFLERVSEDAREERLFDIVNQLNQGVALIGDATERESLAQLNQDAGRKAKESAAYEPAVEYLATGIGLLPETMWNSHYDLALGLHVDAAEAAYLGADFDAMDGYAEAVFENARSLLDKVATYETRILAFKARNLLNEAIDTGLVVLAELGVTFPEELSDAATGAALGDIQGLLADYTAEQLLELPPMTDPKMLGAMAIMADINSSVYWARPGLFALVVFKTVELSVRFGNCPVSAFAYSTYGVVLSGVLGDMRRANEYGELGMKLLDRFDAQAWMASTVCAHYVLIVPWNEHIRSAFPALVQSVSRGLEVGNNEYAAINANNYLIMSFCAGLPLDGLADELESYSAMMKEYKQDTNYWFNQIYLQTVRNLQGRSEAPAVLAGPEYDAAVMLPRHMEANDHTAAWELHFATMLLSYHFGQLEAAEAARQQATALLAAILAKVENATFRLYSSLVLLAQYPSADSERQAEILAVVADNQGHLAKWAGFAPMNYQHKYELVEAERHRVLGENAQAHAHYEQAIAGANEADYLNEEALAYELAAGFFVGMGLPAVAEPYFRRALKVYRQWEAPAKIDYLRGLHPELQAARAISVAVGPGPGSDSDHHRHSTTTTVAGVLNVDFDSVMRAARAISSEIDLARLVDVTMRLVIENAGADRGLLLLERGGELRVLLEAHAVQPSASLDQPAASYEGIAQTVVDYVVRTLKPHGVDVDLDLIDDERDAHIRRARPLAILCVPLLVQSKLLGLIYLENSITPGAFSSDRVGVVEALGTQAAISLENARMYSTMERLVEERTQQLAVASQQAQSASEAKSQFLRSMSHELRTPLNAILGYAQILIERSGLEGKQKTALETIQKSGRHLLALINDVLDMSRIEAGRLDLELAPLKLPDLIAGVADFCRPQAKAKGVDLVMDVGGRLPSWVRADARRLRQVLLNLVGNAVKFTLEGEVSVRARYREGAGLVLSVRDTGPGISPARMETIFQPFVQAGTSEARAKGTGLGLSISRQLVRMMGGELSATSTLGEGATFVLELPLEETEPPMGLAPPRVVAPSTDPSVTLTWPTHAEVRELKGLMEQGALAELARRASVMSETDPDLGPFSEQVAKLAGDFDEEALEELLDHALTVLRRGK